MLAVPWQRGGGGDIWRDGYSFYQPPARILIKQAFGQLMWRWGTPCCERRRATLAGASALSRATVTGGHWSWLRRQVDVGVVAALPPPPPWPKRWSWGQPPTTAVASPTERRVCRSACQHKAEVQSGREVGGRSGGEEWGAKWGVNWGSSNTGRPRRGSRNGQSESSSTPALATKGISHAIKGMSHASTVCTRL